MGDENHPQQEKGINLGRVEPLVSETWCGESLDMLYTRLTVVVQSMAQASTLNNRLAKCATHYDLLVAAPTDDKTLHFCCNTMNVCDQHALFHHTHMRSSDSPVTVANSAT